MKSRYPKSRWRRGLFAGLVAAVLVCLAPAISAAVFENLYLVAVDEVPGANNSREALVRRGMATLLIRITGQREISADPRVADLLSGANNYYDSLERTRTGVRVGFRRTQVNDALDRLGLPIWIAERPATMLWLAVDLGDGQRAILTRPDSGSSTEPEVQPGVPSNPLDADKREQFDQVARAVARAIDERGLPVVLPALSAAERRRVRFADIWGGFDIPLVELAETYQVDAVLMAAVSLADPAARDAVPVQAGQPVARATEPSVRWLLRRGQRRQSRLSADFRAGIDWLADQFAAEFTTTGGARVTWLTVRGIETFPDFGRIRDYLESVSLVESVEPEILTADGELLLRIAARGDDRQLRQVLALDGELRSVEPEPLDPERIDAAPLVFVPAWRQQELEEALP